jgi:hypothetical protein
VDKNNYGPSWIIGLGPYTKGELWIMTDEGTVPMIVATTLRGYPLLQPGSVVMGKTFSINGEWKKFNGQVPHQALSYEGSDRYNTILIILCQPASQPASRPASQAGAASRRCLSDRLSWSPPLSSYKLFTHMGFSGPIIRIVL